MQLTLKQVLNDEHQMTNDVRFNIAHINSMFNIRLE